MMRQRKYIKLLIVFMTMSILGGCTTIQQSTRDKSLKMIPITEKEEVVT